MSATYDPLVKKIEDLMKEAAFGPWDQPATFYAIDGPMDSPEFHKLVDMPIEAAIHPADFLNFVKHMEEVTGVKNFADHHIGLLLINEAWVHLTWEELKAEHPEIAAVMIGKTEALGLTEDRAESAYYRTLMAFQPSQSPEQFRRQARVTTCVLRDGTMIASLMREDGNLDDIRIVDATPEMATETDEDYLHVNGRIPDTMRRFLKGFLPDPNGENYSGFDNMPAGGPAQDANLPKLSDLLGGK